MIKGKGKGHGKSTASGGTPSAAGRGKRTLSSGHPAEEETIIAAGRNGMSDEQLWRNCGVWAKNFLPSRQEQYYWCHVYQGTHDPGYHEPRRVVSRCRRLRREATKQWLEHKHCYARRGGHRPLDPILRLVPAL